MEKVYLITGASSEVGIKYIESLDETTQKKCIVVAHYSKNNSGLEELKKHLNKVLMYMVQADLACTDGVEKICEFVCEKQLVVTHILHLAAAPLSYMKIKKWDEEKVRRDMQIQFFSFATLMNKMLPRMAKNGYGRVVAMLSAAVLGTPAKYMSDYVAVKSALWGYVKGIAVEYADKGVRINGISPNMMETKFLDNIDERIVQMTAEKSSLKRNITVDETVKGLLFLMSDDVTYINGINLNLSGGDYMI